MEITLFAAILMAVGIVLVKLDMKVIHMLTAVISMNAKIITMLIRVALMELASIHLGLMDAFVKRVFMVME